MYRVKWPNRILSAGTWPNKEDAAKAAKEAIKYGWVSYIRYEIVEVDGWGRELPTDKGILIP